MKKVLVIGCPGSGKSTFSRLLAGKTRLPLFHLDLLYWNSDKSTVSKSLFLERLSVVLGKSAWIIDGNYQSTLEMRIKACDTVFFLDYPLSVCLEGIKTRRSKARSDMPWTEKSDEIDQEFMDFVKNFDLKTKPNVITLLEKYGEKNIIVFKTREEAEAYLLQI